MPRPCRTAKGLDLSFPFDLHSAAVFDSHMPCRAYDAPLSCHNHAVLKATYKATTHRGMGATWVWHGMCVLAPGVQRWHFGDLPAFGFFRLPRGVPRRLSEAYQSVKTVGLAVRLFPATTRTFTKDAALSEYCRDAEWHVWIKAARHDRGTAWARHGFVN
jgi:hypothetical protein